MWANVCTACSAAQGGLVVNTKVAQGGRPRTTSVESQHYWNLILEPIEMKEAAAAFKAALVR